MTESFRNPAGHLHPERKGPPHAPPATGARSAESVWLYAVAGALMTGGPVWHYLFVNRYPFDRAEAVILTLFAGLLGAAIAVAGRLVGGIVAGLSFAGLLFVFVDFQFDLESRISTGVVIAGCIALPLIIRARRAQLTCLVLGAFDIASLPRWGEPAVPMRKETIARPGTGLPLLVHLVLDEQWGIGGLRAAGDSGTAQFLTDFYLHRGFEVYEGAYSRSHLTRVSLSEMMSLGQPPQLEARHVNSTTPNRFRLLSNPYFERLRELGYVIDVYQSTYLDYCRSATAEVRWCETISGNTIANISHLRAPWRLRAVLAARYFLNVNSATYARLKPEDSPVWGRSLVAGGLAQLERVRDDIADGQDGGTAMFVHVLAPHSPLEVDGDCIAYSDPTQRVGVTPPWNLTHSAVLTLYAKQVRCVHRMVAEVLAAVDRAVGRDGAIVVVHGDHGARLPMHRADNTALPRTTLQLNSDFSTLLAIRRPRIPGTVGIGAVPIQDYFWELVRKDFLGEVGTDWQHYVRVKTDSFPDPEGTVPLTPGELVWAGPAP